MLGPPITTAETASNASVRPLASARPVETRDVLGRGCSIDLRERAFPAGACAQTLVARIRVIVERTAADEYVLRVRRSFAPYLVAWLLDALPEYAAGG
jgi:sarcosine oxidase subunit gamma